MVIYVRIFFIFSFYAAAELRLIIRSCLRSYLHDSRVMVICSSAIKSKRESCKNKTLELTAPNKSPLSGCYKTCRPSHSVLFSCQRQDRLILYPLCFRIFRTLPPSSSRYCPFIPKRVPPISGVLSNERAVTLTGYSLTGKLT